MPPLTPDARARRLWRLLTKAAANRQTLTYAIVGEHLALPPIALGPVLTAITDHCRRHRLPPLAVLVVQSTTGRPGPGFSASSDIDRDRERVFARDWTAAPGPHAAPNLP